MEKEWTNWDYLDYKKSASKEHDEFQMHRGLPSKMENST